MKIIKFILLLISINIYSQYDSLSIFFESAKFDVSYNQQVTLERFIANLDEEKYNGFRMYGYADYVGNAEYNLELSQKRLDEVRKFLNSRGVTDEMIIDNIAKGELADKSENEIGNSKSRRVDIIYAQIEIVDVIEPEKNEQAEPQQKQVKAEEPKSLEDIENAEVGSTLVLDNLNFNPGTAKILNRSRPVLDKLLEILRDNPSLKIEIQGHICCYSSRIAHDGVAYARAKMVYDYLIAKGISRYRLSFTDFGASRKIVEPELTEADRIKNRRVEIKIISK